MKKIIYLIISLCFPYAMAQAQTVQSQTTNESDGLTHTQPTDTLLTVQKPTDAQGTTLVAESMTPLPNDSIEFSLPSPVPPTRELLPFGMYGITPFRYQGYNTWDLHKGFNASLGMNISAGFGKHALHGVGFGQDAAFLYAIPLNSRLSVAGGVYATNMNWGKYQYRNVGVAAIAAFKVNDCITLYGYGNKSLLRDKYLPAYPLPNYAPDKFGGMVNFKVGESASFSIGVEGIKHDSPYGYYYW